MGRRFAGARLPRALRRFEPRAVVDRLADSLAPTLKAAGFRRSRRAWALRNDNVAVVGFQTAASLAEDALRFTLNIGVWSRCVAEADAGGKPKTIGFDVWDCHLRERLGYLLPDRPPDDYWWIVERKTDERLLQSQFLRYLEEIALPFLRRVHGDAGLRDHWAALVERDRLGEPELRYLETLVRRLGPAELLPQLHRVRAAESSEETRLERQAEFLAAVEGAVAELGRKPYDERADPRLIRTPPG